MAIDQSDFKTAPSKHKRTTYGTGLVRGLQITLRHMLSRTVTVQYPDEQDPLPPRSRGVIALKTENCTVCMLCAKECPDWCIYIDGHKESRKPAVEGKRAKSFNVLDRFAIDYALCMYCGICVEVCPYDALFWSPEFEYAEYDITELTHEMEKLNDWMYTVLPPPALDEKAMGPTLKTATPAPPAPPPPASEAGAQAPRTDTGPTQAPPESSGPGESPSPPPSAAPLPDQASPPESPSPPASAAPPEAPPVGVSAEEARAIGQKVYEEEMAKGSDPRVAEGRRKSAEARAVKGTKGPS